MPKLILATCLLLSSIAPAQTAPVPPATQPAINAALTGDWTGVLEYRDYSEPATSTKRVQLPTWLSIQPQPDGLKLHYIYDDGPTKTVEDSSTLIIDVAAATYKITDPDHTTTYKIEGLDKLKDGHGQLILLGPSIDNDKPAEARITLILRRNLLSWLEEVRPASSSESFAFRHLYTFTRAHPPAIPHP